MHTYKVLREDGTPIYGVGKWHLPQGDKPGEWMPYIEKLVPCKSGYHLCRRQDLVHWLGPTIWRAEYQGDQLVDDNKVVVHTARLTSRVETWNKNAARTFACGCAERVLHMYESVYPGDTRPRVAIQTARAFSEDWATLSELTAARAAARTAAGAAARDLDVAAAGGAAWTAAWAAARAAAWAAARDAARTAAWDAARTADGAAAGAADWGAAWGAAREWQTEHLFEILEGGAKLR